MPDTNGSELERTLPEAASGLSLAWLELATEAFTCCGARDGDRSEPGEQRCGLAAQSMRPAPLPAMWLRSVLQPRSGDGPASPMLVFGRLHLVYRSDQPRRIPERRSTLNRLSPSFPASTCGS
jgi:hypothetical protein